MLYSGYTLLEFPWAELWGRRALTEREWKLKELYTSDIGCMDASSFHSDSRWHWSLCRIGRGRFCDTAWLTGPYCQHLGWAASAWMSWASTIVALPLVSRAEISIWYHCGCSEMLGENLRGTEHLHVSSGQGPCNFEWLFSSTQPLSTLGNMNW